MRASAPTKKLYATICALALALESVTLAPCAGAATGEEEAKKAARALANGGMVAYQAGDFKAAEENLSRAFASFPAPTLALWSARALEKLGKLVEAEDRYRAAERASVNAGDPETQRKAKLDARKERAELLPRIPTLKIDVEGASLAGVIVRVDGVAIANDRLDEQILVNPGERTVSAERGPQIEQSRVTLAPSEHKSVVLKFQSSPRASEALEAYLSDREGERARPTSPGEPAQDWAMSSDSSGWRTVAWVAVGLGGASVITSGALALVANGKRDDFEAQCPDNVCPLGVPQSVRDDVESYNSLRTLSTIGWIGGGALLIGGIGILIALPEGGGHRLSAEIGPGSVSLQGSF